MLRNLILLFAGCSLVRFLLSLLAVKLFFFVFDQSSGYSTTTVSLVFTRVYMLVPVLAGIAAAFFILRQVGGDYHQWAVFGLVYFLLSFYIEFLTADRLFESVVEQMLIATELLLFGFVLYRNSMQRSQNSERL